MIANLIVGGLAAGCLYAMVGIAIVIVLNITDTANFAQGEMAMVTTFFAYWLLDSIGIGESQFVDVVRAARAEEEIARVKQVYAENFGLPVAAG